MVVGMVVGMVVVVEVVAVAAVASWECPNDVRVPSSKETWEGLFSHKQKKDWFLSLSLSRAVTFGIVVRSSSSTMEWRGNEREKRERESLSCGLELLS